MVFLEKLVFMVVSSGVYTVTLISFHTMVSTPTLHR